MKTKEKNMCVKDFNLLKSLYEVYSPSKGEKRMRKFLRKRCLALGAVVYNDNAGNLYVTKGVAETYPCICAHMDQVQKNHSKDFMVIRSGDIIFGYSPKSMAQQGLGADDKNGLWIALELLRVVPVLKCAFFVGEEIGCVGSSQADMSFFSDVRFCIQPDRRNGGDLITEISGDICSEDFLKAIDYKQFGYEPTSGLMTDVEELCDKGVGVSCINISCGYYHPHTDQECTSWSELCNALDFAAHIVEKCTDVYPHDYASWYDPSYRGYSYYDDYYGYDYLSYGSSKKHTKLSDVDDDYNTMQWILENEPYLTFEEVVHDYQSYFLTKDAAELKEIYEDVHDLVWEDYFNNSHDSEVADASEVVINADDETEVDTDEHEETDTQDRDFWDWVRRKVC